LPILEFVGVTKAFGRRGDAIVALDEVTFEAEPGACLVLMGPSGAGKSTLLRLLLAMERADRGTIRVAGRDVARLSRGSIPYLRRNVGAVFQDFKLLPYATALENVALALEVLGLPPREVRRRAAQALARVDLRVDGRTPVHRMSGGEQQRVALARALAARPAILLADEPTGNLDPGLTREVLRAIAEVHAQGTTVLLATHDPEVLVHAPPHEALYLERGRLFAGAAARQRIAQAFHGATAPAGSGATPAGPPPARAAWLPGPTGLGLAGATAQPAEAR
jgi:cell division transport system ATP-binding protein